MKKIFFFLLTLSFLYLSYSLKNFQILLISLCFLICNFYFYKVLNKNIITFLLSVSVCFTFAEIFLIFISGDKFVSINNKDNYSININYEKSFFGYQPSEGIQTHKIVSNGKILLDSKYKIGTDGFRVTPSKIKRDKKKIINLFGGSYVFGWG